MSGTKVRIFVKSYCGWCHEALAWLDKRGIAYDSVDVLEDSRAMEEMVNLSGQSKVPTLKLGENLLADFDVDELAVFWQEHGSDE